MKTAGTGTTMRRAVVAVIVAAAMVVAGAQTASADWFQQSTPTPTSSTAELDGVSCPSQSCVAVGSVSATTGNAVLVEVRHGSTWTVQDAPTPTGAASSQFSAVSCSSATACTAVGSFVTSADTTVALAERWNGISWSIQTVPIPAGAVSSQLEGVSCSSASACTAVGSSVNGSTDYLRLAAVWNGTTWTLQKTSVPAETTDSALDAVACPSPGVCTAVGWYRTHAGLTLTLAEISSPAGWTLERPVNPAGKTVSELDGVSCSSASMCTAVGSGFADRRVGGTWTLERVPRPSGSSSGPPTLMGVSCTSATACSAVGAYYFDGVQSPVAASWNGARWTLQSTPLDTSYDSSLLEAVSCRTAAVACAAVGSYHDPVDGDRTWAEAFALRWQPESVIGPAGSIASDLNATTCTSPNACMGVGNAELGNGHFAAFAEQWDGSFWSTLTTPGATSSNLDAVSCSSATACTAVGDAVSGSTLVSRAERWDGTTWKIQSTPDPASSSRTYLSAVSCASATACMAVGVATRASGRQVTLAESWDGKTWSIHRTPDVTGNTTNNDLTAVSCPSADACTAVGSSDSGRSSALSEVWDGTNWTILSSPIPAGGSDGYLSGVSCSTASICTAVGDYFNGSQSIPLSEHRDGRSWSSEAAATPSGVTGSGLDAVSCLSATDCTAVGFAENGATEGLAERWNGRKWSLQPVAVPLGSEETYLQTVSCPTAVSCTATGAVDSSGGDEDVLVELYS